MSGIIMVMNQPVKLAYVGSIPTWTVFSTCMQEVKQTDCKSVPFNGSGVQIPPGTFTIESFNWRSSNGRT